VSRIRSLAGDRQRIGRKIANQPVHFMEEDRMIVLSKIYNFILDTILGCHHRRMTRPFTIEDQCYMVCLDCGRQRFYSTETMRLLGRREARRLQAALAASPAAVPAPRAVPKPIPAAQPTYAGPRLVRKGRRNVAA
jgi:hypothetical protein